jgi:hypothetical protein
VKFWKDDPLQLIYKQGLVKHSKTRNRLLHSPYRFRNSFYVPSEFHFPENWKGYSSEKISHTPKQQTFQRICLSSYLIWKERSYLWFLINSNSVAIKSVDWSVDSYTGTRMMQQFQCRSHARDSDYMRTA